MDQMLLLKPLAFASVRLIRCDLLGKIKVILSSNNFKPGISDWWCATSPPIWVLWELRLQELDSCPLTPGKTPWKKPAQALEPASA